MATQAGNSDSMDKEPTRREKQLKDEDPVKFGKGSGLDELEVEQEHQTQRKRNNKLKSDDVKHH